MNRITRTVLLLLLVFLLSSCKRENSIIHRYKIEITDETLKSTIKDYIDSLDEKKIYVAVFIYRSDFETVYRISGTFFNTGEKYLPTNYALINDNYVFFYTGLSKIIDQTEISNEMTRNSFFGDDEIYVLVEDLPTWHLIYRRIDDKIHKELVKYESSPPPLRPLVEYNDSHYKDDKGNEYQ